MYGTVNTCSIVIALTAFFRFWGNACFFAVSGHLSEKKQSCQNLSQVVWTFCYSSDFYFLQKNRPLSVSVFTTMFSSRKYSRSRVTEFVMHLCIADMIVCFVMIPVEIGWHLTVAWKAGNLLCRSVTLQWIHLEINQADNKQCVHVIPKVNARSCSMTLHRQNLIASFVHILYTLFASYLLYTLSFHG